MKQSLKGRSTFVGTFFRIGVKNGYKGRLESIIIMKNVETLEGYRIRGHVCFSYTKGFQSIGLLKEGDKIQFDARTIITTKPQSERKQKSKQYYKLGYPTKIKKCA